MSRSPERPKRKPPAKGRAESPSQPGGEPIPARSVPHVWDEPIDPKDPPSQRPEDTHEEARRQRRAG